jgi:formiminotetrahydrofolate cyclodeaminase
LLLNFLNYFGNIGIYIGVSIIVISIVQMIINLTYGKRFINQIIKENLPSKRKLEEKKRKLINGNERYLTNIKGINQANKNSI